ncbi:MAG: hypothetical protein ABW046_00340 [Actinoplanes sp.]
MIALLRSELYRTTTLRSSWLSMACFAALGIGTGWFSEQFWTVFTAAGAFAVAAVTTAQHYQYRTAVLLFLGVPNRVVVLAAQCLVAALLAEVTAAASGLFVLGAGEADIYRTTLIAVPLIAVFGVANATVVRRPTWLFAGYGGWFIAVEGVLGKFQSRLPISSMLIGASGNTRYLLAFIGWTVLALAGAIWSIRRDLSSD